MEFLLVSYSGPPILGYGDTLHDAIFDSVGRTFDTLDGLEHARSWCLFFVRMSVMVLKASLFSRANDYDDVELIELMMESRDFKVSGNTSAARYPLASLVAADKGTTHIVVLNSWADALQSVYSKLESLSDRKSKAEALILQAGSLGDLRSSMTTIIEQLQTA